MLPTLNNNSLLKHTQLVTLGSSLVQNSQDTPTSSIHPVQNVAVRKPFFIGCWNVRTLMNTGSQCLTLKTLHEYKLDVTCLSEVRIRGSGCNSVKIPGVDTSYSLYYSGPTDSSGRGGVAIALNARANKALIAWEPISPRLIWIRLAGKPFNISIVAVYAPTLPSDSAVKDDFYDLLQSTIDRIPRQDILFVAGDWNARPGPIDDSNRHLMGKFSLGHRCDNGDRLLRIADRNNLFISSTRFQHPKNICILGTLMMGTQLVK